MAKQEANDMTKNIIIIVALLVAFGAGYIFARAKYKPQILELNKMVLERDNAATKMKADANKIMMKDGEMWVVENGIISKMTADKTINGTKIMMNGKMVQEDGKEVELKNGDSIDMNGKMMMTETTPSY